MEFGRVEYTVGAGAAEKRLKLTLVGQGDEETLRREGLAALRRRRIVRLASEAEAQGAMLGYEDLSGLLLTSLATLKRDVNCIEENGLTVRLRGRRKNGNGNGAGGNNGADGTDREKSG